MKQRNAAAVHRRSPEAPDLAGERNTPRAVALDARFLALLAALASGIALALWSSTFREVVIDRDEAVYAVVARLWAAGDVPYRDVFDHKPPATHLIYRLTFAAFGESLAAVRAVFALITAAIGVIAALLLRALRPQAGRVLLALTAFSCVYFQASAVTFGGTANSEIPMMLALTTAALAAVSYRRGAGSRWLVVLGVSSGLALLTKPVCALEVVLFALLAVTGARRPPAGLAERMRAFAVVAAAAAAPVAILAGYLAVRGGLAAALEAIVDYNVQYAAAAPIPFAERALYLLREAAKGFAPLLAGVGVLLWSLRRDRRAWAGWFLLAWLVVAVVAVLSVGRPYLHYLQEVAVPLVVAAMFGVGELEGAFPGRTRLRAAWLVLAATLLVPSLMSTVARRRQWAEVEHWEKDLGGTLATRLAADEKVLIWGASPELYWFSSRRPIGRFIYKYPMIGDSRLADRARRELFAAVSAAPPGAIVVLRDDAVTEDPQASDEQWASYWVPALQPLLRSYTRSANEYCIIYLRKT